MLRWVVFFRLFCVSLLCCSYLLCPVLKGNAQETALNLKDLLKPGPVPQNKDRNKGNDTQLPQKITLPVHKDNLTPALAVEVLPYAILSLAAYGDPKDYPVGWSDHDHDQNDETGYKANAYMDQSGNIVVAFGGTDKPSGIDLSTYKEFYYDAVTDLQQKFFVPDQYEQGFRFAKKIVDENKDKEIVLTGHSLGGGIAQFSAALLGVKAYVFNPAGLFGPAMSVVEQRIKGIDITSVIVEGYDFVKNINPGTLRHETTVTQTTDFASTLGSPVVLGKIYKVPMDTSDVFWSKYTYRHQMERLRNIIMATATLNSDVVSVNSPVIVVVDSSGSMSSTDPKNLRLAAIRMMIDTFGNDTSLNLIDFDSTVRTLFSREKLGPFAGGQRYRLRESLNSINSEGGTNIRGGLAEAAQLAQEIATPVSVVLLTDGQDGNWHGESDMLPEGLVVHTIALSDKADSTGLSKLSAATGGVHEIARTAYDLPRIMGAIFGEAQDRDVLLVKEGKIQQGDVLTYKVALNSMIGGYVDIEVSWPGSDIDLVLVDPAGHRFTIADAVRSGQGIEENTYDIIRLNNPKAGTWTIELHGVDLPSGPEPFTLRATTQGGPVKSRWKTNVVSPEVGQLMTVDLSTRENNVRWEKAEVVTWMPNGSKKKKNISLNGVAAKLGGSSGQQVVALRPKEKGVHRIQITVEGKMDDGQKVMRTFDRTFQVTAPGAGVRYKHQIDPFIRRSPGMLR